MAAVCVVTTVTETQIDKVEQTLIRAPECLKGVSLALRSCYLTAAPSVKEFTEFRGETLHKTLIFKEYMLPMTLHVMKNLKGFLDNYMALSMEDWKESLEDIAHDAKKYEVQCNYIAQAYQDMQVDLKKQADLAQVMLGKMSLEKQKFQAEEERLRSNSRIKTGLAVAAAVTGFAAVGAVAAVPFIVSADMVAIGSMATMGFVNGYTLGVSAADDMEQAIVVKTEAEMVDAATKEVKDVLIPAIMGFAEAMSLIAGFFNVVAYEVQDFNGCASDAMEDKKKRHFLLLNRKAETIQKKCSGFIVMAPNFASDLECIPQDQVMNYAQEWLESQKSTSGWPILQGILGCK